MLTDRCSMCGGPNTTGHNCPGLPRQEMTGLPFGLGTAVAIGTCSLCGGRVVVPKVWHGVTPPVPTCESCGATKRPEYGPVIDMVKQGGQR